MTRPRLYRIDPWLPVITLLLLATGIVMIYSASAPRAFATYGNSWHFAIRQGMWCAAGLLALGMGMLIKPDKWERLVLPMLGVTLLLLILVLVPGIGMMVNGARRWLGVGGFRLQPSEIAKIVTVFYMARYLVGHGDELRTGGIVVVIKPLFVVGMLLGLIVVEPDLGNVVAITLVAGAMLFVAGMRWLHIVPMIALAVLGLVGAVLIEPYRMARIASYLNPWADPTGSGFQVVQSFLAFGSGGVTGTGLGEGRQKMFFLPESHTDFIFSVIGEELGLIGAILVLVLFALFTWRGLLIAREQNEPFGQYVALGMTLMIAFQALINVGVSVGVLPNKGLPLPFISYGGSSLMMNLFAVGVLINLSRGRC